MLPGRYRMKAVIIFIILLTSNMALGVVKPKDAKVIEPMREVCVMIKYEEGQLVRIPMACNNRSMTYKGDLRK